MPATDEEIIRDLLHRYTDNVHPPASIATGVAARQRRRDRRRRVVTVAAAGAALGTAAGVIAVVPGHSSPAPGGTGSAAAGKRPAIKLTADQRVLFRLGVVAAHQPQPNGRYAVMSTEGGDVKDTSVIDGLTGNMWSYQEGTDGSPSGKGFTGHYSPTAAQFAAMPTGLSALRAALITQWDNQNKPVESPLLKALRAVHRPIPLPVPVSDDDKVFQQASDILWNPLVGSALRSALYKVLAAACGVTNCSAFRKQM